MPENLSADKKQVIALYNAKGYRDARIVEDTVYYVDDRNLRIDLYVEEATNIISETSAGGKCQVQ